MPKYASLALLLITLINAPAAAQGENRLVIWERWDVTIDQIDTVDNHFHVTEVETVEFNSTFRLGSRSILLSNLETISDIQVYQDDVALREVACASADSDLAPGTFCALEDDAEILILYAFLEPITSQTETFRIDYRVTGALRTNEGGDQLWWIGVPADRPAPVRASTITVELPEGFAPREGIDPVETYGAPGRVRVNGTTVVAEALSEIQVDETFELRVQYPHDEDTRQPAWQAAFDNERERTALPLDSPWLVFSAFALVFGLYLLIAPQVS